jgi:hypothetical protein
MLSTYKPLSVTIGQVIGSYQAIGHYEVITDFWRGPAVYAGSSRGSTGVRESGSITPGTMVWVTYGPAEPFAVILAVMPVAWAPTASDPAVLSVWPQVSGFEDAVRYSGLAFRQSAFELRHRHHDGLRDLVNGEWAMASPHSGAGIGVELFRSWVRGGPMSGLWCWADTQQTRLAGLDLETITLGEVCRDRSLGNALAKTRNRVFYPSEAFASAPPRLLDFTGAIYAGEQRFLAPAAPSGQPRTALFHQHLDTDGAYTVTSARAITLQRYTGIPVPEESSAVASTPLTDQPLDAPAVREQVLRTPRHSVTDTADSGIAWLHHAIDFVESLTAHRARTGIDRLPVQFPVKPAPAVDRTHTGYGPEMWRAMAAASVVTLPIDGVDGSQRFYLGRSMISLLPDGGILLEDSFHSQVLMSGGNIMLSAPHDIILAPGRNLVAVAGGTACIRADQHIDVASNSGRVSVKAESLLQLLGGNGGGGGVVVESRSRSKSTAGTGTAQDVGGLLLKSASGVHLAGSNCTIAAETSLAIESTVVSVVAEQIGMIASVVAIAPNISTPGYSFSQELAVCPGGLQAAGLTSSTTVSVDGDILATGAVAAIGPVIGSAVAPYPKSSPPFKAATVTRALAAVTKNVGLWWAGFTKSITAYAAQPTPFSAAFRSILGFSFATSNQLGTNKSKAFELPETRWQTMSRRGNGDAGSAWRENPVVSPAGDTAQTAPFPGYDAWATASAFRLHATDLHIDLATGLVRVGTDKTIPPATLSTINLNYRTNA